MYAKLPAAAGTAVIACLLSFCGGCRQDGSPQPEEPPTSPPAHASTRSADAAQAPASDGPTWVPPDPPWYASLSARERRQIDDADAEVTEAHGLWRQGQLDEAEAKIAEARATYQRLLGDEHWKTWDCGLDLSWLRAEHLRANQSALRKTGLRHMIDIPAKLQEISEGKCDDSAEAPQRIDDICDFLHAAVGSDYPLLSACYRQWCLGNIAFNCRKLDQAQAHYARAAEHLTNIVPSNHYMELLMRNNLTWILLSQDKERHLAREQIATSLRTLRDTIPARGDYVSFWLNTLHALSSWLRMEGRHGEAKAILRGAIDLCKSSPSLDPKVLTAFHLKLAHVCSEIGDHGGADEALDEISKSALKVGQERTFRVDLLIERGLVYWRLGDFSQACDCYEEALRVGGCDESGHQTCWKNHYYYGMALTKDGRFDEARKQLGMAACGAPTSRSRELSTFQQMRAEVFMLPARDDRGGLRELMTRIEALKDLPELSNSHRYRLLGRIAAALGDDRKAADWCGEAAEYYKKARAKEVLDSLERAFWHENASPYRTTAICQLRLGHELEALESLELHSGQGLMELLTRSARQDIEGVWNRILTELGGGAERTRTDEASEHDAAPMVFERPDVGRIVARLLVDDETAIVGWIEDIPEPDGPHLPDRWAFVLHRSGDGGGPLIAFEKIWPSEKRSLPEELILAVASRQRGQTWSELAYQLYEQRFAPLMPHLEGVNRLYVLSRGPMLGIPVEMLPLTDPGEYGTPSLLGERFAVAYGPSSSVLAELVARQTPQRRDEDSILLVGAPLPTATQRKSSTNNGGRRGGGRARVDQGDLPASGVELKVVSEHFKRSKKLEGHNATENRLYEMDDHGQLREYRYVHFATHAWADLLSPEQCRLVLSPPERPPPTFGLLSEGARFDDGMLRYREIERLNLDADLVVLSACDTGLGRKLETEGYLGLPHAFFAAGARALVITMWPVEDNSAAILMNRFYSNLVKRMPPAVALQNAKQYLRHLSWNDVIEWGREHNAPQLAKQLPSKRPAYDHPFYWAGYVLIGPHG